MVLFKLFCSFDLFLLHRNFQCYIYENLRKRFSPIILLNMNITCKIFLPQEKHNHSTFVCFVNSHYFLFPLRIISSHWPGIFTFTGSVSHWRWKAFTFPTCCYLTHWLGYTAWYWIAVRRTSLALLPIFWGKSIKCSIIDYNVSWRAFIYMLFIRLKKFPSIPSLLEICHMNGCWFFSNSFSASINMIMWYSFYFRLFLVDYIGWFLSIKLGLRSQDKLRIVEVHSFYTLLGTICFSNYYLRFLHLCSWGVLAYNCLSFCTV